MTRPALRPLTAATAALVAGAVGAVPATAAGVPLAPSAAAHSRAPRPRPALVPPAALPADVGATATRGPGATQTGLVATSAAVSADGDEGPAPGGHVASGRAAAGPARARGPPG